MMMMMMITTIGGGKRSVLAVVVLMLMIGVAERRIMVRQMTVILIPWDKFDVEKSSDTTGSKPLGLSIAHRNLLALESVVAQSPLLQQTSFSSLNHHEITAPKLHRIPFRLNPLLPFVSQN